MSWTALLARRVFRFFFWLLTHTVYRLRVLGRENIPAHGPGLLVCNHVSYADGFFILASHRRMIRFVVWSAFANSRYLRWLSRIMGVIPIAADEGPRALAKSLRAARDALRRGELVCMFAEGQISRTGNMLRFKRGFEKVVQGTDAPIIPTFLDRVWGSIFSYQGLREKPHGSLVGDAAPGHSAATTPAAEKTPVPFFTTRFRWRWPKQWPYPVTVGFGKPLPPSAPAWRVRRAVQELGAECVKARKNEQKPLHRLWIRRAARHPFRFAMADSQGTELSFGKALAGVIALSRVFRRRLGPERMVGVLLPPSVGGTLTNLGLLAAGKIPINLNYTASSESVASSIEQCEIKTVISSPQVMKRLRITLPFEPTAIERLRGEVTRMDRLLAMLGGFVLPGWITEHWLLRLGGSKPDDLVTVIFSSGSTGEPKGVMLSHHNVLSNSEAAIQVIDPTPADRVVGILPLFHSFGFLANLWVPFLVGAGAIYHVNPLDAKEVGELIAKYGGTILLATPTFLRTYTRKIPVEQLKTLRLVVTGAEKLPREVAEAFGEKFGIEPMEGYGCTELSPVVSVSVPDVMAADGPQVGNKPGSVGHPVPGVAARVADPDTGAELPPGENGLLLIKGANVMVGYWNKPELTREAIRDGWYVTGDVANIDEDGFITITDRLSRFSKIGGEMVPHLRIEEAIRRILQTEEQGAAVVGVPDPTRGERLVVLHPPLPISSEELWRQLNSSDLPKLWVPARDAFHEVPELPYLGTGKLDLRRIKQMALERAGMQPVAAS
jgi:acyl-[acyl-carrier-protein]-phospholipid O-acyltransferase/long-chain-fatty-acid--[acyl-carrier-protein] ligase